MATTGPAPSAADEIAHSPTTPSGRLKRSGAQRSRPSNSNDLRVIVPSLSYETFGLTAVEALAVGCPVIVRDLGPLPEIVEQMNRAIHRSSTSTRFITAVVAILDPARGTLTSVNAGHNPPLLLSRAREGARELKSGGLCLGMFEVARYQEERVELLPGDVLVLYSDGVTEARDARDEEFGTGGLETVLRRDPGASAGARS